MFICYPLTDTTHCLLCQIEPNFYSSSVAQIKHDFFLIGCKKQIITKDLSAQLYNIRTYHRKSKKFSFIPKKLALCIGLTDGYNLLLMSWNHG